MGIVFDILKDIPFNEELHEKIKELEKRYEELEAESGRLKKENQELKVKINELTNKGELCADDVKIMLFLASRDTGADANAIAEHLKLGLAETEDYLDNKLNQYVRSVGFASGRPAEYYLTQKGGEYLVKNDLV